MTVELPADDEHGADGESRAPFTIEELRRRRRDRPLRELPTLTRAAVQLVRRAAKRELNLEIALSVIVGVVAALQLIFTRSLLQRLLQVDDGRSASSVVWPLLGFTVAYTVGSIASLVQGELRRVTGELVARYAQNLVARAATSAELVDFERPAFHDRLRRAMANASTRPAQVAYALISIISALLMSIGVVVALAVVQPVLLPLVLLAFVPMWVVSRAVSRLAFTFEVEETEADRRRAYLMWLLTDKAPAKEVRAYALDGFFAAEHRRLWDDRIARLRSVTKRRARVGTLGRLTNGLLYGVIVLVIAWLLGSDRMSVSDAAVAAGGILLLGARLGSAVGSMGQLYESSLFLDDVMRFLDETTDRADPTDEVEPAAALERIEVRGVHFAYPAATADALRGIDVTVDKGEVIALVGANGSGKTTLAKVLGQLYEPASGVVLWNGVEVEPADRAACRAQVAFVFQDFERYHFTAAENIGFGDSTRLADRDAVIEAARRAGADQQIVDLVGGYDSLLGPQFIGGTDLSIGQWQRMAIARAFFRDAGLVILDEPSAALDPDAEAALFARLRELCRDRAVVVVSHRFSTVKSADRIYVLDRGAVLEHGTHAALLAADGAYARMFRRQASPFTE